MTPRLLLLACALGACTPSNEPWGRFEPEAKHVAHGRDPSLHVFPSGKILLLSAEARGGEPPGLVLRASEDGGDSYVAAANLDRGGEVEAHGEGRPVLRVGPRLEEYVMWSERGGEDERGKRLWFKRSVDFGRSFSPPVEVPHASSASFFDCAVDDSGTIALAWISYAPVTGARPGSASIVATTSSDRGERWSAPSRVVTNVCPCCRPRLAAAPGGAWLLAWRAVEEGDLRDVFLARSDDRLATISAPVRASADGWRIDGCPHSGASLAVAGDRVWLAWSSGASGEMKSYLASSPVGALAFDEKREIGAGLRDVNHPELAKASSRLWLAFQARETEERASFAPMRAWLAPIVDGELGLPLAAPPGTGSALYPTLAPIGDDQVLVAWTDSSAEGKSVSTARARITDAR